MPTNATSEPQLQLPWFVVKLGELLEAAMSSQWVVFILVPVMVTLGAMYVKAYSRANVGLQPADKVFGFDLGITACVTLLISGFVLLNSKTAASVTAKQHYIVGLFVVLAFFAALLALGAWAMHKFGWDGADASKTKKPMPVVVNVGGAVLLILAFVLTGGSFK